MEKKWKIGGKKYDEFVKRVNGILGKSGKKIMTPRTDMLEKIADMETDENDFIRLCLVELSENYY